MPKKQNNIWNKLKVNWYQKAAKRSGFTKETLKVILPNTKGSNSFLDIGAGCGTLSIPLALKGNRVTAIEPSLSFIEVLKDHNKKHEQHKIKTINRNWGLDYIKRHDVVLCANVPELLKDNVEFLKSANTLARHSVFLITNADPHSDKFYYKELYPLIFNKEFTSRSDYSSTYMNLHEIGIYANIKIIEYDFDQPFKDIEEAVSFWKEYMGIVTEEHDVKLKGYLNKKLKKDKSGLVAKFHKKSAVIWWKK